ncbi:MAG: 2-hydroxyacyl-CoA dehydratase [Lachnospiraceae bacterium]|jgi:benzoyl-CoA reductase/2-hydroxyglutaryl-CoA dehydratase subunit BcrC/BadD/HgdB|nr:2-hydroxyacyl-CoA dehydratase [Lachnospiraceae bacterium]
MGRLSELLKQLTDISQTPDIQLKKYLGQGKKVIGCFPPYVPEELAAAAGMVPMGIWGSGLEPVRAKAYLPSFCCPIMHSSLEMGLDGTVKGLSAVMIPALCDALRCITQNWKVGVKEIPVIPVTYPQNRKKAGLEFLESEYHLILKKLEEIAGREVEKTALEETLDLYNRHSKVMMDFAETANQHLDIITPFVRHAVMKSAWFMEKAEHLELVKEVTEELRKRDPIVWKGKKVVLTGILAEPAELLAILEECHIAVVGDDLAQESRQYRTPIPDGRDGIERLAGQWGQRNCSLIHDTGKRRIIQMREAAENTGATGVIVCMMKFCDPEEYDAPLIGKLMGNSDISVLNLEIDQQAGSMEQLRTRIETFAEMI